MTLVELLVALVILAAVATSVAVSSANLLDRSRVEKTVRQGEAIAAALERSDGLSIVSDLGPVFDFASADPTARNARNLARLNYLISDSAPSEVETADGEIISLSSVVKKAPRHKVLTTDLIPTNFPALVGRVVTAAQLAALTNSLPSVSLGCGWRGPYCEIAKSSVISC